MMKKYNPILLFLDDTSAEIYFRCIVACDYLLYPLAVQAWRRKPLGQLPTAYRWAIQRVYRNWLLSDHYWHATRDEAERQGLRERR